MVSQEIKTLIKSNQVGSSDWLPAYHEMIARFATGRINSESSGKNAPDESKIKYVPTVTSLPVPFLSIRNFKVQTYFTENILW